MSFDLSEFDQRGSPASLGRSKLRRRELASDIVAAAYLRGDFLLTSGQRSDFYFDKYLFETRPTILRRVAQMLAECIPPEIDRVAGPELGAVALAAAVSLETGLPFIIVRKQAKRHGTSRSIEGEIHPNERVLLVEDVVSTGGEALKAAAVIRDAHADVAGILAVVDREQGGEQNLIGAGYSYRALYHLSQLRV